MANLSIIVQDGNNLEVLVTPQAPTTITLDRGVAGIGVESMTLIDVGGETYIEVVYTNGTSTQLGPLEQGVYFGVSPISVTGNDISLNDTAVTAGNYGSASKVARFTVDGKGRLTAASDQDIAILLSQVTDAGTIASQNANNVNITGGSISGTTVNGYIPTSQKAAANGVATLDSGGTVPLNQIPASIQGGLIYQGTWNASTNTPTLTSSVGSKGHYYAVSVAGTTNLNGITDWNVGDLAVFNGSVWEQIDNTDAVTSVNGYTGTVVLGYADVGAANSGANTNINSMSGLTGGVTTPDFITFDTTPETVPTAEGSLYWDSADGVQTLNMIMAGGTATQQIGQEIYYRIKASSAITDGQVVMFTGTVGNSGALTGAPAAGLTAATASYVMGIATQDIALNGWGYVTAFGVVHQLNTSAFSDGQILYLDPAVAGGLTSTVPSAPNPKVQVCAVVHAASNGSLFVRPSFGGTFGMFEGDVGITSPTDGQLLIRNQTAGKWVNAALSAGTGVSVTNGAGSVSIANTGVTSAVAGTGVSVSAATGAVTISNTGVTSAVAGTGISVSSGTGAVTISNTGVTSVTGTSPVSSTGGATPAISLASGYGDTLNPYAAKTANYILAAPNGVSGAPTFRAIVAADIPTLNQDTTGTAANVTGVVAVANGGTGASTQSGARTGLGATTVGANMFTLTNPSAITFPRFNADNTISALNAADFRSAIGAGTSSTTGTVTSVATGTGLSGGPITSSGTISLANTAVTAGSYTYGSFTVDAQGRLTAASSGTAPVTSVSASAPISSSGGTTPSISLASSGVTAGSYSAANITVDAYGRITSAANGTASLPTGAVIQTQSSNYGTFSTSTSASMTDSGLTVNITPSSSSSKIFIIVSLSMDNNGSNAYATFNLVRNGTALAVSSNGTSGNGTTWSWSAATTAGGWSPAISYLDSPGTTSTLTYKIQFAANNGGRVSLNRTGNNTTYGGTSTITVMEIKG